MSSTLSFSLYKWAYYIVSVYYINEQGRDENFLPHGTNFVKIERSVQTLCKLKYANIYKMVLHDQQLQHILP